MKKIIAIAVGLLLTSCASSPPLPKSPQTWTECNEEQDCMELRGFCNSPFVINKKYEDQYRSFKRKEEPKIQCEKHSFKDWPEVYKVTCLKRVCSMRVLGDDKAPKSRRPFPKK